MEVLSDEPPWRSRLFTGAATRVDYPTWVARLQAALRHGPEATARSALRRDTRLDLQAGPALHRQDKGDVSFEMFLIPTYLGQSPIHGFGVFTAAAIEPGTCIWEFVDGVDLRLSPRDLETLPANIRPMIQSYCYREASGMYVLCGDNAKFMNHSTQPSCDDNGVVTIVRTGLPADTELTCDYRNFDHDTMNGQGEWYTAEPAEALKN